MEQQYYVAKHLNRDVCQNSSSGGVFTALTDSWFDLHGEQAVVYGCAFDEKMHAKHIRAVTREQRDTMRGSKYIGSDMSGVMRSVVNDIKAGRYVLFSGTPCQVAGLKAVVLEKGLDNRRLLTIDLICHGIGSVTYFQDYLAEKERRYKSKAVFCSFRGKKRPGKRQQMVIRFENGKEFISPFAKYDVFSAAYSQNYILRPSCFHCKYASNERNSDISIGDFWEKDSGVSDALSTVIVQTEQGKELLKVSIKDMDFEKVDIADVMQPHLCIPAKQPEKYGEFWKEYRGSGIHSTKKYLNITVVHSVCATVIYHLYIAEIVRSIRGWLRRRGK